ncbi:MAG: HEPN domain-containing protein [Bifidobacterium psychraerophilum]|uniref:ApeA N-terminal domain 1-containing protein n=1 Tax=Bifidobacterium psychraerophilum TaxID=218140 RepID=UPI0039EBC340
MVTKLEPGVVRIAHTRSGAEGSDEVVVAELDTKGVLVSWPRALGFVDASRLNDDDRQIPEPLILRDGDGWLTLAEGYTVGASASSLGHSLERLRYTRVIHTGVNGVDYVGVNGMTSEIDGLAKWAKLVPVTTQLMLGDEGKGIEGVSVVAKNLDSLPLGGPLDLQLETSYSHNPTPKGGVFTISTALLVRTRSPELASWQTHQQTHRMMQDLMCLVYGKPCGSRLISVMREDDQELPPTDERRYWRDAYQPSFGRAVDPDRRLTDDDNPLFFLDEANADRVAKWLSEYSYWSRPTWIAMSVLFHRTLPIESRLLQVAVALEALGYAIAERANPDKKVSGTYEALVKNIFDFLGYEPDAVVGKGGSRDSWCKAFNQAYKGVKHADNDLTEGREAWTRAREGLILIRCWFAAALGVSETLVTQRLREGRVGV